MSPRRTNRVLWRWLDERYELQPLVDFARSKEVPLGHHSLLWYYLGGLTLFFFIVQIGTGTLLLAYYEPGENTSYESIRYLTTKVPFGWLMRSIHVWSAHFMIVSLLTHMFSTLMLKAYRAPRELTWLTGFFLFSLALTFGFSGYLLPWNELAFFATAVGTDSVKSVPLVGQWLLEVLRGGPDITIHTLYRFFALHVVVLPLITFGFIAMHLLFVQRQGMAPPIGMTGHPRGMRFFPSFAVRDLIFWLVVLVILGALAVYLPYGPGIPGVEWELGEKADPLKPAYPGIKPEWYFLWIYQLLKEFPPHILGMEGPQGALLMVGVLLAVWMLVPWLDRASRRNEPTSIPNDFGVAAILFIAYLSLKGWDVGASAPEGKLPDPDEVALYSSLITTAAIVAITLLRLRFGQRFYVFTAGIAVQVVGDGLLGLHYLVSSALGAVVAAAGLAYVFFRRRKGRR